MILKHYRIGAMVYGGGMSMWVATACIMKDKLIVQVPESDEEPFTAPSSFREIKKSEYVALTEE
jgi:hypothetical protein